jgi:hypothetical protein
LEAGVVLLDIKGLLVLNFFKNSRLSMGKPIVRQEGTILISKMLLGNLQKLVVFLKKVEMMDNSVS